MALTIDQVVAGCRKSRTVTFNQEAVSAYVLLVGDTNSIHTDVDFARKMGLERTIVPGEFILGKLVGIASSEFPFGAVLVGEEVKFKDPLYVDDIAELILQVIAVKDTKDGKVIKVSVEARSEETIYVQGSITAFYKPPIETSNQ